LEIAPEENYRLRNEDKFAVSSGSAGSSVASSQKFGVKGSTNGSSANGSGSSNPTLSSEQSDDGFYEGGEIRGAS